MNKKDEIQKEIVNTIIKNNFKGIILASVRTGKTRILLNSIKEHSKNHIENPKILVLYPNIDIKNSWKKECDLIAYHPNITYCTFISIEKVKDLPFAYICVDEAHLLAENQLKTLAYINKKHKHCILASGTYSDATLESLRFYTGLNLIVNYSTEQAIKDEIVSNFSIEIHTYNLDNTTVKEFGKIKKWKSTEYKELKRLSNKIINSKNSREKMFNSLNRMRFINSCSSLINCVNNWIKNNPNERFLLFTGDENVGKKYNLPMYNSKSKTNEILVDFQNEKINQLCLIRKGSSGITYPNLKIILLTAINSNGENLEQQIGRSLLNDANNAIIHIFISSEEFQLKWLKSALENINKNKIKWIKNLN